MAGSICDLKPGETALDALNLMAATVTASMTNAQIGDPLRVSYPVEHYNFAVQWVQDQSKTVPPFWPHFREVVAALCAYEPSAARRQVLATKMMERCFTLTRLVLPYSDLDAQSALRNLRQQDKAIDELSAAVHAGRVGRSEFCKKASILATELGGIADYLSGLDKSMKSVSCIDKCIQICSTVKTLADRIASSAASTGAQNILESLKTVRTALRSIMHGYATLTGNESIPSFILMRLLVRFGIDREEPDNKITATIASALLTVLLHKGQDWLFDLLQDMIVKISVTLHDEWDGRVCFFLKGGRGIAYLLGQPTTGEKDWDTQILIDPHLPPTEWRTTFLKVRDSVNNQLLRCSFVFSANLMNNAPTLIATTRAEAGNAAKDSTATQKILDDFITLSLQGSIDEQALLADPELVLEAVWQKIGQRTKNSCKAELIDVGLPRYYTIELLEQWRHARPTVSFRGGVPVPTASYFIEDHIAMVREIDAGMSPSPVKRGQRLTRLLSLLAPGVEGLASYLERQTILAKKHAPRTLQEIAAIRQIEIANLMTVLLGQFAMAYQLEMDPNFAAAFDRYATATLTAKLDVSTTSSIDKQASSAFIWCNTVSDEMARHLSDRGGVVLSYTAAISSLLAAAVADQAIVPVFEDRFAICMYGQRYGSAVRSPIAPAPFAVARLMFRNCASASEITSQFSSAVVARLQQYIAAQGSAPVFGSMSATDGIKVFAARSIPLGTESYVPLLVELVPTAASAMVTLTLPHATLCGLESLKAWCRERAADVSEWATHRGLCATFGALIEMEAMRAPSGPVRKAAL